MKDILKAIISLDSKESSAKNTPKQREGKVFNSIVQQANRRTRIDIGNWRTALTAAENVENPNRKNLYNIYDEVLIDALLTSQIQNRKLLTLGNPFEILQNDKTDKDVSDFLNNSTWFYNILSNFLDTIWWGHSLFEFYKDKKGTVNYRLVPRKHVLPSKGMVIKNEGDEKGIEYTELKEYGNWIIDAGSLTDLGLLNKAVSHVLIKRFAQTCWSEYCEIYGMPPRILKTNTQDNDMLYQAKIMMEQMGSAGWAIIDESETFEYADTVNTNGEVYNQLIKLCNNELSLLNSGAIIGQDTEFGSRGKELSSQQVLNNLVKSDKKQLTSWVNSKLLPALSLMGIIPYKEYSFSFIEEKDTSASWLRVAQALEHYDIDPKFIDEEFNIPVTRKKFALPDISKKV